MDGRFRQTLLLALAVVALALATTRAAAQDLPQRPTLPKTPTTTPEPPIVVSPERRGSPVETPEALTGERINEGSEGVEEIETDRDSFTPATTITPHRRFILESAYSFIDNRGFKEGHSFPELILRYGLTDRVELRIGWNAEMGGGSSGVSGFEIGRGEREAPGGEAEREYQISYGAKFRITDQARWVPRSIVIVQGFTPTGGSTGTSTATALVATYAAGWLFPNRWQFDAAMRYGFDSEERDQFNQWAPSAVLRVPLGEKWATHIEYFGFATSGKERNTIKHFISPGVRYLVTSDFELGVRVGWGLNDQSARFFVNTGFGWRF